MALSTREVAKATGMSAPDLAWCITKGLCLFAPATTPGVARMWDETTALGVAVAQEGIDAGVKRREAFAEAHRVVRAIADQPGLSVVVTRDCEFVRVQHLPHVYRQEMRRRLAS